MNDKFEILREDEMVEVDGGVSGIAIVGGVILVVSAVVSAFNGYVDEANK